MKKVTNNIIIFLLLTVIFCSCKKDFLEVTPKGKLIAKTISDYNLSLNSTDLLTVGGVNGGSDGQVLMGDEMAAIDPYFSGTALRTQRLFHWDDVVYEPNQDASEMTFALKNIYAYNKIINEVMGASDGTEQQKKSLMAEARAGRAWTYFLLINYYGKPYNAATSSSDAGFPIITLADVTQTTFTRPTVKEVYDFIVEDLTSAIPDLPTQITNRMRMCKAAAEAVLGKVNVFMGKFNEALPFLNAAIADLNSAAIPTGLYDYNSTFGSGGIFLPIGTFGPSYPSVVDNQEDVYARQFVNYWTFVNNEVVINPQTVALYGPSDFRLKFFSTTPFFGSTAYPLGMLRRVGPTSTQFGVVVPDLFLLRAECKARLNDLPGAQADVEALRVKRMPPADATVPATIVSNQTALVKFILEERIREFAVQGFRWFDMRRLSVDPVYSSTVGNTHNVYSSSGSISNTYTLRADRFVLRLSQKVIDQNPGMQNNP